MSFPQFLRQNAPFLAAGALLTFCSSFGQTFLISVFAGEIRAEFGLTDGDWGRLYGIGTLASGLVMIWAGVLTDHFRARYLGAVVLVLLALACLAMALAPAAWALPFVIFALRFTGQGMISHIAVVAMARWFVGSRGKALAIASLGYAVGEAFLPLFIVFMFDIVDWWVLWFGFAVFVLLMIPLLSTLLRLERTPQSVAEDSQSTGMHGRHWSRRDTIRHWLFWLMVPAILGPSAWITALFFQQVHLAETKGWSHAALVTLFPLYTGVALVATLATGALVDRLGSARLIAFAGLPIAAGFVVLGATSSLGAAAIGLALVAIGHGANATIPNVFWAEFYGTRSIGSIKALATAVMVLGSAAGPWITGAIIDAGLAFEGQMFWIAGYFVAVVVLVWAGVRRAARALG
ncbi:Permeases of the major facilitator superfamily [Candidatus Rhodobacter oscarellae]|uniref:Permeases of the major facilitator superfamily n=1 Tax=Candidatus Rhodobacter oscarellae TaxID=1675527 RepID=A0A0J9E858_9RHOB|nr:MFS transporter [Candidatus Rhodobacter lobularis]KMW58912.1 Permeases of the major facilitator superfamily [Candidatus Rhodobacter lobularis]